jgi:hypothetical protein
MCDWFVKSCSGWDLRISTSWLKENNEKYIAVFTREVPSSFMPPSACIWFFAEYDVLIGLSELGHPAWLHKPYWRVNVTDLRKKTTGINTAKMRF